MKNELTKSKPTHRLTAAESVGRRIRDSRQIGQMSQRELAQKAATSQSRIALVEAGKGNPTLDLLEKIVDALGQEMTITFRRRY